MKGFKSRKDEIKELDKLCSEYIRKRAMVEVGGCERCLAPKYDVQKDNGDTFPAYKHLQWAHFKGRNKHTVRWDIENAAGLCGGCHMYLDDNAHEKDEWFKQRLGDRYDLLLARVYQKGKVDREAIRLYLQEKLKDVE